MPKLSQAEESKAAPAQLILLGTKGGPSVRDTKQVPASNAIVIGRDTYIVDTGWGVTARLIEKNTPLISIRDIFITHQHSDHNLELGPLVYNAWANGLKQQMDVYGPEGMEAMMKAIMETNRFDIETRIDDEGRPDFRKLVKPHTYHEGLVMENDTLRVLALRNSHPPIHESYALKFLIKGGKTIVFSGDTAYFPPLAKFAEGADYLVHEVMNVKALTHLAQRSSNAQTLLKHLMASHTSTRDVGRIAQAAKVKNLVLTHFVPGADPSMKDEDWLEDVRAEFSGNIIVGHDLLEIPLN